MGITTGFFVTETFYRLLLLVVVVGVTLHLLRLKTFVMKTVNE